MLPSNLVGMEGWEVKANDYNHAECCYLRNLESSVQNKKNQRRNFKDVRKKTWISVHDKFQKNFLSGTCERDWKPEKLYRDKIILEIIHTIKDEEPKIDKSNCKHLLTGSRKRRSINIRMLFTLFLSLFVYFLYIYLIVWLIVFIALVY